MTKNERYIIIQSSAKAYHLRQFFERSDILKKEKITEMFSKSPLFKSAASSTIEYAANNCTICKIQKGETFDTEKRSLFILLEGIASVYGTSKTHPVILNTLKVGRVFGMASLFGERCDATSIIAKDNCTYAVIPQTCIEEMLKKDIGFTKNYICFLSDKIRFLSKKIAFFTAGSTEKKLAGYLLSLPTEHNTVKIEMNMTKLAQNLNIGRASLYRAFDVLEANCFITRENNIIKITSPEEFRKIYGETL